MSLHRRFKSLSLVAACAFALLVPTTLATAQCPGGVAGGKAEICKDQGVDPASCVVYDHSKHQFIGVHQLDVGHQEPFTLLVVNTVPPRFTYPVVGVEDPWDEESGAGYVMLGVKRIDLAHDSRFGGYEFEIKSVSGTDVEPDPRLSSTCPDLTDTPAPQLIFARTSEWLQSLAGAYTMSSLTDPVFSLYGRPDDEGGELQFVDESSGQEDEASLGLGAFIHLYHSSWDRPLGKGGWALSFGLGLDSQEDVSYFLGPSYRFGDKGAITAGAVLGPVQRLPNGVGVCARGREDCGVELAVDQNALSNLPSQHELGFFISLSYSFLKVQDAIEKPFKSLDGGGSGAIQTPGVDEEEELPVPEPDNGGVGDTGAGGQTPEGEGDDPATPTANEQPDDQGEDDDSDDGDDVTR